MKASLVTRIRHVLTWIALALLVLILAGATYQGVSTAFERRAFPYPGRLVDVGDHQLHLFCTGEGSPTVILESPAAGMTAAWGWVQPAVARQTRVCSYDRAGLGWSEAGDRAYDPLRVPDELHALLANAREREPVVLVGQGLGAAFARLFAMRYPDATAALVLIDLPEPGVGNEDVPLTSLSPWLARSGILRATGRLARRAAGLPEEAAGPMRAFLNRPDHLTRAAAELGAWDTVVEAAAAQTDAIPVVHVDAGKGDRIALLDREPVAARATDAILGAVAKVRAIGH